MNDLIASVLELYISIPTSDAGTKLTAFPLWYLYTHFIISLLIPPAEAHVWELICNSSYLNFFPLVKLDLYLQQNKDGI